MAVFLDAVILWDVEGKFQIKVTRVTNLNVSKETAVREGKREGEGGGEGKRRERDRQTDRWCDKEKREREEEFSLIIFLNTDNGVCWFVSRK